MSPAFFSQDFPALRDTDTVAEATRRMLEHRVSDLPIVDAAGKLVGIFKLDRLLAGLLPPAALVGYGMPDLAFVSDDLDSLRRKMRRLDAAKVRDFAVKPDHVVHPDTAPVEVVLQLDRATSNLPVVDRDRARLVGMVSARDVLGEALMHGDAAHAAGVIFGWSPLWVATTLFVVTYLVIMSDRLNRAIVALLGAGLLILLGVLDQKEAMAAVDFNTLGLLLGMMLIVNITRRSGLFQYVAIWSAKKVDARPWGILLMMSIVTAVFSAFLDNVTTVLLTVPVTLLITDELKVKPYPYLFAQIFASNIGGTATLIGDPPNIMIGSATGLTFNDFGFHLTPVIIVVMAATMVPIYFIWGRRLRATDENRRRVMSFNERETITDPRLLKQSLVVIALTIAGFMLQRQIQIEPATIAVFGAAVLLLLDNLGKPGEEQSKNVHSALSEAEWITLMFFLGLFVLVHGIQKAGLIDMMADGLLAATRGDFKTTTLAILWASAVLSALIDNIPFVATMIPLIKAMGPAFGGEVALLPLWWALSLGACLGGNGTLIGASANLIVAGLSERAGVTFRFVEYMKIAFPLMLLSIAISHAYMLLRYL